MTPDLAQKLLEVLDSLVERIADRAAAMVVERLREDGWGQVQKAEEQLLDVDAVAGKLQVPKSAVYKMATSGSLPAVKMGGRLRVRVADVEQFIHDHLRSDARAAELARAAQTSRPRGEPQPRTNSRGAERTLHAASVHRARPRAARRAAEPALKVVTNNNDRDPAPAGPSG